MVKIINLGDTALLEALLGADLFHCESFRAFFVTIYHINEV